MTTTVDSILAPSPTYSVLVSHLNGEPDAAWKFVEVAYGAGPNDAYLAAFMVHSPYFPTNKERLPREICDCIEIPDVAVLDEPFSFFSSVA